MIRPLLDARGISFTYPGAARPLFSDLDLAVGSGEVAAVLGRSGCGKSTLLYLLGLFLSPDSGRIVIGDQDTAQLDDAHRSRLRAHRIGFVFQDAALHPGWTIEENVAEGAFYAGSSYGAARARARLLLDDYGILQIADHLPTETSGGQAQRAALCRALIQRPSLILTDEPTGNLDPDNAEIVLKGLRAVAGDGAAVVVVTHSPVVAEASDRTIRLA